MASKKPCAVSGQTDSVIAFADLFHIPPQWDDLRNFLMSEECANMARVVANLAWADEFLPDIGQNR
jgi:hypothetical protein